MAMLLRKGKTNALNNFLRKLCSIRKVGKIKQNNNS